MLAHIGFMCGYFQGVIIQKSEKKASVAENAENNELLTLVFACSVHVLNYLVSLYRESLLFCTVAEVY